MDIKDDEKQDEKNVVCFSSLNHTIEPWYIDFERNWIRLFSQFERLGMYLKLEHGAKIVRIFSNTLPSNYFVKYLTNVAITSILYLEFIKLQVGKKYTIKKNVSWILFLNPSLIKLAQLSLMISREVYAKIPNLILCLFWNL